MKPTLFTVATSAALLAPSGAVTFVNGSFEDISATYVNEANADHMNTAAAPGWSIFLNSPDWFWGEGPDGLWETPFGDHFAIGAATGSFAGGVYREGVNQVVSGFTVGQPYEISFSHANGLWRNPGTLLYEGVGTVGGWQVLVDGISVALVSSTNDNSTTPLDFTSDWQTSSVTFTATAATHDIQFVAFKPDGLGQDPTFQFLDHASVTLIPEPSTVLLGGLAVLLAAASRRRAAVTSP